MKDPIKFGERPAAPHPVVYNPNSGNYNQGGVEMGGAYYDVGGLSIKEHVYLTLYAAVEAASTADTHHDTVDAYVKERLPRILESMANLHEG